MSARGRAHERGAALGPRRQAAAHLEHGETGRGLVGERVRQLELGDVEGARAEADQHDDRAHRALEGQRHVEQAGAAEAPHELLGDQRRALGVRHVQRLAGGVDVVHAARPVARDGVLELPLGAVRRAWGEDGRTGAGGVLGHAADVHAVDAEDLEQLARERLVEPAGVAAPRASRRTGGVLPRERRRSWPSSSERASTGLATSLSLARVGSRPCTDWIRAWTRCAARASRRSPCRHSSTTTGGWRQASRGCCPSRRSSRRRASPTPSRCPTAARSCSTRRSCSSSMAAWARAWA